MAIRFGEAVASLKVGVAYSEAPASCSLISPKIYRNFVFPYQKQVVDHFKEKKVGVGLHICGFITPILEDIVNTGITNLSIDAPTDLVKAVEATRKKAVLIGNVNTNLFYSGTRQEMEQAIKDCLAVAPEDSGFILSSGCEVPGVAQVDKIAWFMDIINEVGRYA
jgi:uroporphyrinogen decarboxylase